jgi:hypothetical protein
MKILSLGAGVQSSTIFLMSCYGEIERIDHAVFADTGWESESTYRWIGFLDQESKKYGIPIHVVRNGDIRQDALISQVRGVKTETSRWASMPYFTSDRKTGKKGMIRRQCTNEYKIIPIEKKARELAGYKKYQRIPVGEVEIWKGISTDERSRANMSRVRWIQFYYPLLEMEMSRKDCRNWFSSKGLPQPPRSSCLGCPFHDDSEWKCIKESPEEWADVVAFDKAIRKCGGMRGDVFLHAKRIPLDEVDFTTAEDMGQLNLLSWRDECAGVCGV